MPIYPAGSLIETRLLSRTDFSIAENRVFFTVKNTPALPFTLRDHIRSVYMTALRGVMSNRGVWYAWKSRRIDPPNETTFVTEPMTDLQGGVTSNLGFEGLCFLLVYKTADFPFVPPGRTYTPYSYGGYLNGSMELATLARLDTLIGTMNAQFTDNGASGFLKQMKRTKISGGVTGFHFAPVTSFEYRAWNAIQRSRAKREP
jgi:hypothetical protein